MKKQEKINPKVKDVLILLGAGTFLAASIIMPGFPMILKPFMNKKREKEQKEWEKYNLSRLRVLIKRLQNQKIVKILDSEVRITDKGKRKILKYNLDDMKLEIKTDGKWRVIIYDVSNLKRPQRDLFRKMLGQLDFLRIQKSVYLTPFVCDQEIEYLRQVFEIGGEVLVLKVSELENSEAYRKYFGI